MTVYVCTVYVGGFVSCLISDQHGSNCDKLGMETDELRAANKAKLLDDARSQQVARDFMRKYALPFLTAIQDVSDRAEQEQGGLAAAQLWGDMRKAKVSAEEDTAVMRQLAAHADEVNGMIKELKIKAVSMKLLAVEVLESYLGWCGTRACTHARTHARTHSHTHA